MAADLKKTLVINLLATYNEKDNVGPMVSVLDEIADKEKNYEFMTLVVDSHSPDGTGEVVRKLMKTRKNLYLLETPRGLGISLIQGLRYALNTLKADIVIPNDCDFQWDPNMIPAMLRKIEQGDDVIVPSRHVRGGKDNFSLFRKITHFFSNTLLNYYWAGIREVHDLAGNFKAIRVKGVLDKVDLSRINVRGFVIQATLIYELSKAGAKFAEIPAVYGERRAGKAKVGFNLQFIKDVIETFINATRIRIEKSQRFLKFGIVGFTGFVVNFIFLRLFRNLGFIETLSWLFSTELALANNFIFNNIWTFRESKIAGIKNILIKFLQFNLTSAGALVIQSIFGPLGVSLVGVKYDAFVLAFVVVFMVLPYNYLMYNLVIWKTWKIPFLSRR